MRIAWTAEAAAELDAILSYIADQDRSAAALVVERVLQAQARIRQFPKAARYDAETDTYDQFIPKTRIVPTYAIRDDAIWMITTWHTSRDPETKLPRR